MGDIIQFVDGISASPTVRLDLNDGTTWGLQYEGTDFSPPELRQAWASTLLADGERLTASAYENRRIRLRLDLMTTSLDDAYTQIQLLHRELDRQANLLRYWPVGASKPVFARIVRSGQTKIREYPGSGLLRTLDVEMTAAPALLGLKETLATTVVPADPAASGGCYLDVTGVQGDVETPLYLTVDGGVLTSNGRRITHLAVRRRGTPSQAPMLIQAESMTMDSVDTTVQANSALMSGAGSNYIRTTWATTAAMAARAHATAVPASPSVDARGRYRIYARVRQTIAGAGSMAARIYYGYSGQLIAATQDAVTLPTLEVGSTPLRWVDLGDVVIPVGWDPVTDGPDGTALPVRGVEIWYYAQRVTAGGGNLDLDALLLVPADDATMIIQWPGQIGTSPTDFVADSDQVQVYGRGASADVYNAAPPSIEGGGIMVSPGVTNRVYVVRDVASNVVTGDDITASTTITPHYWPRYLYVRPVAS